MPLSRRQLLQLTRGAAMASTFLPFAGRHAVWAHPAEAPLATRPFGRTGREVTTFGLAGGNKVMWDLPGDEAVAIVVKAVRMGMTYLETANSYQLSQQNYHRAFRILNLIPGQPGYDAALRARLFLATKTRPRYGAVRDNSPKLGAQGYGVDNVVDDLKRALSQFFGDGKGFIPEGAYLDLMQVHSLTHTGDIDAIYEGLGDPDGPRLPRIGALAALLDYRDGSNLTGLNPDHRRWIRHIGITGHENAAAHMEAIRRDTRNIIDTLLVAVNPNDRHYFCHQTNSLPVAAAKNMGIIGMKIFADGALYGLEKKYASRPGQSVSTVGQPGKVPYQDFLQYSLSAPGVSTVIAGIGLTDPSNDPTRDQLVANLAACQSAGPLDPARRRQIEERTADLHGTDTNFFQRTSSGLQAPARVTVDARGQVRFDTGYAAAAPLARYEIWRRDQKIGELPYRPQLTPEPFAFADPSPLPSHGGGLWYKVRAVDTAGAYADSASVKFTG